MHVGKEDRRVGVRPSRLQGNILRSTDGVEFMGLRPGGGSLLVMILWGFGESLSMSFSPPLPFVRQTQIAALPFPPAPTFPD